MVRTEDHIVRDLCFLNFLGKQLVVPVGRFHAHQLIRESVNLLTDQVFAGNSARGDAILYSTVG